MSGLAAGLYSLGVPKNSIIEYEAALKADSFLVMAHGSETELSQARHVLDAVKPTKLDTHSGAAEADLKAIAWQVKGKRELRENSLGCFDQVALAKVFSEWPACCLHGGMDRLIDIRIKERLLQYDGIGRDLFSDQPIASHEDVGHHAIFQDPGDGNDATALLQMPVHNQKVWL